MSASSVSLHSVDSQGDGQGPHIALVTRLAIHKRLFAEGADISLCTTAVNNATCRAIVESAIRRDLSHAIALSAKSQVLFMHQKRLTATGCKRPGPGIVQAFDAATWMRAPGTYYWVGEVCYIVDEKDTVRTTLLLNNTQLIALENNEGPPSVHTCEPVLDRVREVLDSISVESSPTQVFHFPRTVSQTNRVTPHLPAWLRESRLGVLIVASDERQYVHICHAAERVADKSYFSSVPKHVLVDAAIAQEGREVFTELLSSPDQGESIEVVPLPVLPSQDWDDGLAKLPTQVQRWWEAFCLLKLPREARSFSVILTPPLARTLLKILRPGEFRADNWRDYRQLFTPGAAFDLKLGDTRRQFQERKRFL